MLAIGTVWAIVFGAAAVVLIGIILVVIRGGKGPEPAAPVAPPEADEEAETENE